MARDYRKIIQALLNKAQDHAVTQEEAAILMGKVAELMMRHGISEEEIRQKTGRGPEELTVLKLDLPGDHGTVIIEALWPICQAFGAKGVVTGNMLTLVGTVSMLGNLEIMIASLELQMVSAANKFADAFEEKARKQNPTWTESRIANTTDRQMWDFIRGYGDGVASKIARKRQEIIDETPGNALVLRTEADRIKAAFTEMFPNLSSMRGTKYSSAEAKAAGFAAGKQADIGDTRVGGNSGTRALT